MLKNFFNRNSLFRNAGIYTVSNIISSAVPFIALPVFTRYLSPTDYGIVATFTVLIGFLSAFVGLNTIQSISINYFESKIELPKYIGNCLIILTLTLFIVILVFLFYDFEISQVVSVPNYCLWIALFICFLQFIPTVLLAIWQAEFSPFKYVMFQSLNTLLNTGLSIVLVVYADMHWLGRVYGQLISTTLFSVAAILILFKKGWIRLVFDRTYFKTAVLFGIPLIPHALGGWLTAAIDRVFINKIVSVHETGIYSVGFQIGAVIYMIGTSINNAWAPWLFLKLSETDANSKKSIIRTLYGLDITIIIMAILLSFFAPIISKIFLGKDFSHSSQFIIWIGFAYALKGMQTFRINFIYKAGKTSIIAVLTILTGIIHSVINYFLITKNGSVGAAQTTLISFTFSLVATWIIVARLFKLPWLHPINKS